MVFFTTRLPAGTYYIGDLCYALPDSVYYGYWENTGFQMGRHKVDDYVFAVGNTYAGDGVYHGSDGKDYPVDAGIIGIADIRLCRKELQEGITKYKRIELNVVKFRKPVHFTCNDGVFNITSGSRRITIDTKGEDIE